jgi:hypothetical protein
MLVLSSRRLLVLLEKLPDSSEFKKWAVRNGDWSDEQKMLQLAANEISKFRASYHAAKFQDGYEPTVWMSPGEVREMRDEEAVGQELEKDLLGQLFGGMP